MRIFEIPKGKHETFGFSAENPTGSRNGGTRGKDCEKLNPCAYVKAGETLTLCETDGPGMITHIWFASILNHNFIIRMYWDNNPEPSVEAPVSAFFGHAYDQNMTNRDGNFITMNSEQVMLAAQQAYNCYWEMPFRKHCKITIENRGGVERGIFYMITGWRGEIPEDSGYFHAGYSQEHPVTKGKAFTVVDTIRGRGRFAGMFLAVGLNGEDFVWVEGEARMYIDGDIYPTINYTGTEDYIIEASGADMKAREWKLSVPGEAVLTIEKADNMQISVNGHGFTYDTERGHLIFTSGKEYSLSSHKLNTVRIITDKRSVEFFINEEISATYVSLEPDKMMIIQGNDYTVHGKVWELRSIWEKSDDIG